jgi:hypothetical protein
VPLRINSASLNADVRKHMETSALAVGRTYYQLTFADPDMTMPGVEPLVFLGHVDFDGGGDAFAFQDTVSYVRFGSRLELKQDHDEITVYFLSEPVVGSLHDVPGIAREVAAAAQRAASLRDHGSIEEIKTE